jgi:hypothetical protein
MGHALRIDQVVHRDIGTVRVDGQVAGRLEIDCSAQSYGMTVAQGV